jgi:uncharacterized cupin superfamily protein
VPEQSTILLAVQANEAPPRINPSNYPEPFASMMAGRIKRPLGAIFRLQSFGVNHVTLPPGAVSALHHRHLVQDEFVMVLTGVITLVHDAGETVMNPGMCAGFPHNGTAHHLVNRSDVHATYLEVGDRQVGDAVSYPRDDLEAERTKEGWQFFYSNGTPY